jgi:outer membrane usher protein
MSREPTAGKRAPARSALFVLATIVAASFAVGRCAQRQPTLEENWPEAPRLARDVGARAKRPPPPPAVAEGDWLKDLRRDLPENRIMLRIGYAPRAQATPAAVAAAAPPMSRAGKTRELPGKPPAPAEQSAALAPAAPRAPIPQGLPPSATRGTPAASQPLEAVIARVVVNSVSKGDATVYRGAGGAWLARAEDVAKWGLKAPAAARIEIEGEQYVRLERLRELRVTFDERSVTLDLRAAPGMLPRTEIDLAWRRRPGTIYPADSSLLFNYGLSALGDRGFGSRTYQGTTELAARAGSWLLYSTTSYQDGGAIDHRMTRLLTNVQYDDRPTLRRFTAGDFYTPGFDVAGSVGMGGLSLSKLYRMDPYFVQYPTAGFTAQVALPSTVEVRVDGNLVAQQQVQPGTLDVRNVTAAAGQRNVSVVIRDPFGREQVFGQPFYFTQFGLAQGLHEYSYNLGALRRQYGYVSNDYGHLAASAYHRYAFSDALTLGLRGEGDSELFNFGPFATVQFARAGIVGLGVSGSDRGGARGHATGVTYSYARDPVTVGFAGRYFSRDFAQLADEINPQFTRSDEFAAASLFFPRAGTFSVGYSTTRSYVFPERQSWTLGYTRQMFGSRAILSANYTHAERPTSSDSWLVSLTWYFDREYSAIGRAGGGPESNFQSAALQKVVPRGEGYGYLVEAGRAERDGTPAAVGRGQFQLNATHAIAGVDLLTSSDRSVEPGATRAFVAGGIGYVDGTAFASRPIVDSFALVKVGEVPDVPVYANGWLQGRTDDRGKVVATELNAFFDNEVSFRAQDLPLNYQYPTSRLTISPPNRSGSVVNFGLRAVQAVYGALVLERDGKRMPLELRELEVTRGERKFESFTARRGEFYFEDLEPGEYAVHVRGEPSCTATIRVRRAAEPFVDLGAVPCT